MLDVKPPETNSIARWRKAIALLSMMTLLAISTGCVRYRVISADRELVFRKAGETVKLTSDAVIVPFAAWLELRGAMKDEIERLEAQ